MKTNQDVYSTHELNTWIKKATQKELIPEEVYLLEKYVTRKDLKVFEAGTGAGRILYYLEEKGLTDLTGFDFVEEMIANALEFKLERQSQITFLVDDATQLRSFTDNSYDVAIYLQQIISLVPPKEHKLVIQNAIRVLKNNGLLILSALNWHSRQFNPLLSYLINFFRLIRGQPVNMQLLPWLKKSGKSNCHFMGRNEATIYWFDQSELIQLLASNDNIEVLECKTGAEIIKGRNQSEGMFYVVARKKK